MNSIKELIEKYKATLNNAKASTPQAQPRVTVNENERFTLYSPNGKHGVNSLNCKARYDNEGKPIYPEGWQYLTEEEVKGLAEKRLAWAEDGTLVPYTKTDAEILVEVAEEKAKRASAEIAELQAWLDEVYDVQIKQAQRCERLGVPYDNKYGTVAELDTLAAEKAGRIKELREALRR